MFILGIKCIYVTIPMDYGERMPAPSADDQISWSPLGSGRDIYDHDETLVI